MLFKAHDLHQGGIGTLVLLEVEGGLSSYQQVESEYPPALCCSEARFRARLCEGGHRRCDRVCCESYISVGPGTSLLHPFAVLLELLGAFLPTTRIVRLLI